MSPQFSPSVFAKAVGLSALGASLLIALPQPSRAESTQQPASTATSTPSPSESKLTPGSTIYRCIDSNSKIWLVDSPIKDASCKKIEVPAEQNVAVSPDPLKSKTGVVDERLRKRNELRDKLRSQFEAAEKKLADAQAALEAGRDPKDDERIATQSRPDPGTKPDKQGRQPGRGGLVTCTTGRRADGEVQTICPAVLVPSPNYYERLTKLEKAVEEAQAELDKAREEFRRNAPS
jgi:hypothetical protein